jgi:hypothetical protein
MGTIKQTSASSSSHYFGILQCQIEGQLDKAICINLAKPSDSAFFERRNVRNEGGEVVSTEVLELHDILPAQVEKIVILNSNQPVSYDTYRQIYIAMSSSVHRFFRKSCLQIDTFDYTRIEITPLSEEGRYRPMVIFKLPKNSFGLVEMKHYEHSLSILTPVSFDLGTKNNTSAKAFIVPTEEVSAFLDAQKNAEFGSVIARTSKGATINPASVKVSVVRKEIHNKVILTVELQCNVEESGNYTTQAIFNKFSQESKANTTVVPISTAQSSKALSTEVENLRTELQEFLLNGFDEVNCRVNDISYRMDELHDRVESLTMALQSSM